MELHRIVEFSRPSDKKDAGLLWIHAISPKLPEIEFYRRRICYFLRISKKATAAAAAI
jgi:hypothetical protein